MPRPWGVGIRWGAVRVPEWRRTHTSPVAPHLTQRWWCLRQGGASSVTSRNMTSPVWIWILSQSDWSGLKSLPLPGGFLLGDIARYHRPPAQARRRHMALWKTFEPRLWLREAHCRSAWIVAVVGALFVSSRRVCSYKKFRFCKTGTSHTKFCGKTMGLHICQGRFHNQMWAKTATNAFCVPPHVRQHCAAGVAVGGVAAVAFGERGWLVRCWRW